jgi:hypothetical protein
MNYKSKLLKKHLSSDETDEPNKDEVKGTYDGANLLRGKEEEERGR